jgi:hypothetical protein
MDPTYNDQSVPFGSRTEVTTNGTFIFEDINITHPTKTIERPDQIGQPNGFVLVAGLPTGTAVVQIPLTSSNIPHVGDTFQDTFLGNASETWVISHVSPPITTGGYRKVNVNLVMAHLGAGGYIPSGTPGWRNT